MDNIVHCKPDTFVGSCVGI